MKFIFLNILCYNYNWVQWIPHLVRDTGIDHWEYRIVGPLHVIEYGLWNVYELEHDLLLVFSDELRQFNLKVHLITPFLDKLKYNIIKVVFLEFELNIVKTILSLVILPQLWPWDEWSVLIGFEYLKQFYLHDFRDDCWFIWYLHSIYFLLALDFEILFNPWAHSLKVIFDSCHFWGLIYFHNIVW